MPQMKRIGHRQDVFAPIAMKSGYDWPNSSLSKNEVLNAKVFEDANRFLKKNDLYRFYKSTINECRLLLEKYLQQEKRRKIEKIYFKCLTMINDLKHREQCILHKENPLKEVSIGNHQNRSPVFISEFNFDDHLQYLLDLDIRKTREKFINSKNTLNDYFHQSEAMKDYENKVNAGLTYIKQKYGLDMYNIAVNKIQEQNGLLTTSYLKNRELFTRRLQDQLSPGGDESYHFEQEIFSHTDDTASFERNEQWLLKEIQSDQLLKEIENDQQQSYQQNLEEKTTKEKSRSRQKKKKKLQFRENSQTPVHTPSFNLGEDGSSTVTMVNQYEPKCSNNVIRQYSFDKNTNNMQNKRTQFSIPKLQMPIKHGHETSESTPSQDQLFSQEPNNIELVEFDGNQSRDKHKHEENVKESVSNKALFRQAFRNDKNSETTNYNAAKVTGKLDTMKDLQVPKYLQDTLTSRLSGIGIDGDSASLADDECPSRNLYEGSINIPKGIFMARPKVKPHSNIENTIAVRQQNRCFVQTGEENHVLMDTIIKTPSSADSHENRPESKNEFDLNELMKYEIKIEQESQQNNVIHKYSEKHEKEIQHVVARNIRTQTTSNQVDLQTVETQTASNQVDLQTIETQTASYEVDLQTIETQTTSNQVGFQTIETQTESNEVVFQTIKTQTALNQVDLQTIETQTASNQVDLQTVKTQTASNQVGFQTIETQTESNEVVFQTINVIKTQTASNQVDFQTIETQTASYEVDLQTIETQTASYEVDLQTIETQTTSNQVGFQTIETQTESNEVVFKTIETQTASNQVDFQTIKTQTASNQVDFQTIKTQTASNQVGFQTIETQTASNQVDLQTIETQTASNQVEFQSSETSTQSNVTSQNFFSASEATHELLEGKVSNDKLVLESIIVNHPTQTETLQNIMLDVRTEKSKALENKILQGPRTSTSMGMQDIYFQTKPSNVLKAFSNIQSFSTELSAQVMIKSQKNEHNISISTGTKHTTSSNATELDNVDTMNRISNMATDLKNVNDSLLSLLSLAKNRNLSKHSYLLLNHYGERVAETVVSAIFKDNKQVLKNGLKRINNRQCYIGISVLEDNENKYDCTDKTDFEKEGDSQLVTAVAGFNNCDVIKSAYLMVKCNDNEDVDSCFSGYASTLDWDEYVDYPEDVQRYITDNSEDTHVQRYITDDSEDTHLESESNFGSSQEFDDSGYMSSLYYGISDGMSTNVQGGAIYLLDNGIAIDIIPQEPPSKNTRGSSFSKNTRGSSFSERNSRKDEGDSRDELKFTNEKVQEGEVTSKDLKDLSHYHHEVQCVDVDQVHVGSIYFDLLPEQPIYQLSEQPKSDAENDGFETEKELDDSSSLSSYEATIIFGASLEESFPLLSDDSTDDVEDVFCVEVCKNNRRTECENKRLRNEEMKKDFDEIFGNSKSQKHPADDICSHEITNASSHDQYLINKIHVVKETSHLLCIDENDESNANILDCDEDVIIESSLKNYPNLKESCLNNQDQKSNNTIRDLRYTRSVATGNVDEVEDKSCQCERHEEHQRNTSNSDCQSANDSNQDNTDVTQSKGSMEFVGKCITCRICRSKRDNQSTLDGHCQNYIPGGERNNLSDISDGECTNITNNYFREHEDVSEIEHYHFHHETFDRHITCRFCRQRQLETTFNNDGHTCHENFISTTAHENSNFFEDTIQCVENKEKPGSSEISPDKFMEKNTADVSPVNDENTPPMRDDDTVDVSPISEGYIVDVSPISDDYTVDISPMSDDKAADDQNNVFHGSRNEFRIEFDSFEHHNADQDGNEKENNIFKSVHANPLALNCIEESNEAFSSPQTSNEELNQVKEKQFHVANASKMNDVEKPSTKSYSDFYSDYNTRSIALAYDYSAPLQTPGQIQVFTMLPSDTNKMSIDDYSTVAIIDNGSGSIKSGLATYHQPVVTPAFYGTPNYQKVFPSEHDQNCWIGDEANRIRGILKLRYPVQHGIVEDWDGMEKIWDYIFDSVLQINPEDYPVIQTEPPNNPKRNRERLIEIMMETYNVPAYYVVVQAVMALYDCGRTTGIVLDSGDSVTNVVPVYEGYGLPHAVQRLDVGGRDITAFLQQILTEKGTVLRTSAEYEISREIKENQCFVCTDPDDFDFNNFLKHQTSYQLPDGEIISLDSERIRGPEILFRPAMIGHDCAGIHQMLYNSIQATDIDLRSDLFRNIILSGGSTLFHGLKERLHYELTNLHSVKKIIL